MPGFTTFTNSVPSARAILGALAAGIVAVFTGIPQLVGVIIYFIVYQQVENYLIAPRVMKKAVEMSAAAVIVSLLIGGSLAGLVGALLGLPAAAIIKISFKYLYLEEREEAIAAQEATRIEPG